MSAPDEVHDAAHEERLEALLVRGLSDDAPEVRALTARCGRCRRILAGMRDDAARLDRAGGFEREVLRAARALPDAPGESAVAGTLATLARGGENPHGMPRADAAPGTAPNRRAVLGWLAAAAIVAVGATWFAFARRTTDTPIPLGGSIELVRPRGRVAKPAPFEWRDPARGAEVYEIEVWTTDAQGRRVDLVTPPPRVRATSWNPGPELVTRWNAISSGAAEVQWRVTGYDAANEPWARSEVASFALQP